MSESKRVLSEAYRQLRDQGASHTEAQAILHAEIAKAIPIAVDGIMADPRIQALIKAKT